MHIHAPILLRNIFVSFNMELFCRINLKPRNAPLPVMLDCSQYGKTYLSIQEVSPIPWFVRVGSYCEICRSKTCYLIQRLGAYSVAPARVTSSVCLRVRGFRPNFIVRLHSYDDIGSITTYRVPAALYILLLAFLSHCIREHHIMLHSTFHSHHKSNLS